MHTYAPNPTRLARDLAAGLYLWTSQGWALITDVQTDTWLTTIKTTTTTIHVRPHERVDVRDYYEGGE